MQEFEPYAFKMRDSVANGHPGPSSLRPMTKGTAVRNESKGSSEVSLRSRWTTFKLGRKHAKAGRHSAPSLPVTELLRGSMLSPYGIVGAGALQLAGVRVHQYARNHRYTVWCNRPRRRPPHWKPLEWSHGPARGRRHGHGLQLCWLRFAAFSTSRTGNTPRGHHWQGWQLRIRQRARHGRLGHGQ